MTVSKNKSVKTGVKVWVKPKLIKRSIDEFGQELIAQIKAEALNIKIDELKKKEMLIPMKSSSNSGEILHPL